MNGIGLNVGVRGTSYPEADRLVSRIGRGCNAVLRVLGETSYPDLYSGDVPLRWGLVDAGEVAVPIAEGVNLGVRREITTPDFNSITRYPNREVAKFAILGFALHAYQLFSKKLFGGSYIFMLNVLYPIAAALNKAYSDKMHAANTNEGISQRVYTRKMQAFYMCMLVIVTRAQELHTLWRLAKYIESMFVNNYSFFQVEVLRFILSQVWFLLANYAEKQAAHAFLDSMRR